MKKISIDPVTRIEGHMKIEVLIDNGEVKEAFSSGTMFRGLEMILKGRHPLDATRITQRICGVCPASHAMASALSLDNAFNIKEKIPDNARIIRNLILASNFLQSHILHFYHLAALDYVDITSLECYEGTNPSLRAIHDFLLRGELSPFVPRYEGDYRLNDNANIEIIDHYGQALDIRTKAHEMLSIFGGKMPHNVGVVAGGVTCDVTSNKIVDFLWRAKEIQSFVDYIFIPDVLEVAEKYSDYFEIGSGCKNFLSYGGFDTGNGSHLFKSGIISEGLDVSKFDAARITEEIASSWYADSSENKNPEINCTTPDIEKESGYSFIKSPRYNSLVYEVGPLARTAVSYSRGDKKTKELVDSVLKKLDMGPEKLFSVMGRHAARTIETKLIADAIIEWAQQLKSGESAYTPFEIPDESTGIGLTEAPRGSLGHWLGIRNKKIEDYQVISPTTWNASPRDEKRQPGPIEEALSGTRIRDEENPFEIVRTIRSFDPCLACSVHCIDSKGNQLRSFKVG